jgi:hypothetical protein
MRSQSKGIGSADNSASIRRNIRTIPAREEKQRAIRRA